MNCPRCNASVKMQMNRCGQCGQTIQVYKRIVKTSNLLYNVGLEKVKVRDLSGAILSQQKPEIYKRKTFDARNLLGLVYYEMGNCFCVRSGY